MTTYVPEDWVIAKLRIGRLTNFRVVAGWSGGFASGNHWRVNSGIIKAEREGNAIAFYGAAGSKYLCDPRGYAVRMTNAPGLAHFEEYEVLPESTDWINFDWSKVE